MLVGLAGDACSSQAVPQCVDDRRRGRSSDGEHVRIHDPPQASATVAAWTGAEELMARLGHSSPRAALRYQHAATSRDREIAARLDQGSVLSRAMELEHDESPGHGCPGL